MLNVTAVFPTENLQVVRGSLTYSCALNYYIIYKFTPCFEKVLHQLLVQKTGYKDRILYLIVFTKVLVLLHLCDHCGVCLQGVVVPAVSRDVKPLLRPVPVLHRQYLHTTDQPRLLHQSCEYTQVNPHNEQC